MHNQCNSLLTGFPTSTPQSSQSNPIKISKGFLCKISVKSRFYSKTTPKVPYLTQIKSQKSYSGIQCLHYLALSPAIPNLSASSCIPLPSLIPLLPHWLPCCSLTMPSTYQSQSLQLLVHIIEEVFPQIRLLRPPYIKRQVPIPINNPLFLLPCFISLHSTYYELIRFFLPNTRMYVP